MGRPLVSIGRRVRFHHVAAVLDVTPGEPVRVLDAGCGDGRLAIAVARRWPQAEVVALDSDAAAISTARRHGKDLAIEWVCGGIGDATVSGLFGLIVSTDVLEHVSDDAAALRWLGQRLTPAGRLVMHVPAAPQTHLFRSLSTTMEREVAAGRGPHLREGYSRDQLTAIAESAGLHVEYLGYTFHRRATRWAADVESWSALTRRRWVKLLGLPALLLAAAAERRPSAAVLGNGLLLVARPAGPHAA